MIRAAVIFMLLSLAVPVKLEDEFEEPEDASAAPPKMEVPRLFLANNERFSRHANASEAAAMRGASQHLKEETAHLFRAIEACRKSVPRMSNRTFNLQLYGGLMADLFGAKSEAYKSALRRCNISEELVSRLKAELSQLEIFRDVLAFHPRNDSSESPKQGRTTKQPNLLASKKNVQTTALESNLNLNIGEEWLQVAPKVTYMSHIYLGSSIYPIMTEESRVLDKDITSPSPSPTEAPVSKEILAPSGWVPSLPWREPYRLISTFRPQENTSRAPRLPRSLRNSTPKSSDTGENRPPALHRLDLLPRNPQHLLEEGKSTECRLDLKKFEESRHYRLIHKLCSAILKNFKRFLKKEVSKGKTGRAP